MKKSKREIVMTDKKTETQPAALDNMRIWSQVDKTDPDNTKKVDLGYKFTAIDAYTQIQRATELWGPVGIGWGWNAPVFKAYECLLVCEVCLWYMEGDKVGNIHVVEAAKLKMGDKPDDNAHKKTLTGAITKGLSYLGFNADVFLGRFDDNKYIQERKAECAKEKGHATDNRPAKKPVDELADAKRAVAAVYKKYGVGKDEALKMLSDNYDQPVREFSVEKMKAAVQVLEQMFIDKGLEPVEDDEDFGGL